MSIESIRNILIRAATDEQFRKGFFEDKYNTISKYNLTEEEKKCLYELTPERLEDAAIKEANKLKHVRDIRI